MAEAVREKHLFRLAYGVLALTFWVSVAGFAYLMTRPHHDKAVTWSRWKPSHQGLDGAREIAHHIAPLYKQDDGAQLAAIQEHPPILSGQPLEAIGIRKAVRGRADRFAGVFRGDRTLVYGFCGLGKDCTIAGKQSVGRELLLRRAAVELSLYSLEYLHGIDGVVSLLPIADAKGNAGLEAVYFRRDSVRSMLAHPLRQILPNPLPPRPSALDDREAGTIGVLTSRRTFAAEFQPLPDGDGILVLQADAQ